MQRRPPQGPAETAVTTADGVRLRVRRWPGDGGAPFLLVHGLASNARLWDGVAERLATAGHSVAAVDLRGHGRSDRPDHGYDFDTLTADLASVVDELGDERPVVAGQSWGANVVVELAAARPALVRGVVCVDGGVVHLAGHLPEWESCLAELGPPEPPGLTLDALESEVRAAHPDWPEEGVAGTLACYEAGLDGTAVPRLTRERHLVILRHLWQHRPAALLERMSVPVLLAMCHGGDGGEGWELAAKREAVARLQRAPAVLHTTWFDADHDVHAQRPDEVAALLHAAAEGGLFP